MKEKKGYAFCAFYFISSSRYATELEWNVWLLLRDSIWYYNYCYTILLHCSTINSKSKMIFLFARSRYRTYGMAYSDDNWNGKKAANVSVFDWILNSLPQQKHFNQLLPIYWTLRYVFSLKQTREKVISLHYVAENKVNEDCSYEMPSTCIARTPIYHSSLCFSIHLLTRRAITSPSNMKTVRFVNAIQCRYSM